MMQIFPSIIQMMIALALAGVVITLIVKMLATRKNLRKFLFENTKGAITLYAIVIVLILATPLALSFVVGAAAFPKILVDYVQKLSISASLVIPFGVSWFVLDNFAQNPRAILF